MQAVALFQREPDLAAVLINRKAAEQRIGGKLHTVHIHLVAQYIAAGRAVDNGALNIVGAG